MPIDLRLRENLEEAIAAYKHYDLLMVNAMFDGMNLIAKEGPLVNERHGVSLLSENTGAHEELAEFALSVNPFDVQEQADAIHRALTMSADERSWRAEGLKRVVTARDPGDWVDDQLADIEAKRRGQGPPYGLERRNLSGMPIGVLMRLHRLVLEEMLACLALRSTAAAVLAEFRSRAASSGAAAVPERSRASVAAWAPARALGGTPRRRRARPRMRSYPEAIGGSGS